MKKNQEKDIVKVRDKYIEHLVDDFNERCEAVIDKENLFKIEITRISELRIQDNCPEAGWFDADISLKEYFDIGWDLAERGNANSVILNIYKYGKAALKAIADKYHDAVPDEKYYLKLNTEAEKSFIWGAASCMYYQVLKSQGTLNISPKDNANNVATKTAPPFKWKADGATLFTLLYDLYDKGYFVANGIENEGQDGVKAELVRFICSNFVNKEGSPMSRLTIEEYLKPAGKKARKRIKFGPPDRPGYLP